MLHAEAEGVERGAPEGLDRFAGHRRLDPGGILEQRDEGTGVEGGAVAPIPPPVARQGQEHRSFGHETEGFVEQVVGPSFAEIADDHGVGTRLAARTPRGARDQLELAEIGERGVIDERGDGLDPGVPEDRRPRQHRRLHVTRLGRIPVAAQLLHQRGAGAAGRVGDVADRDPRLPDARDRLGRPGDRAVVGVERALAIEEVGGDGQGT